MFYFQWSISNSSSCISNDSYFAFFLIIDLYLLIPAVILKIFNPIAELVIPIGIPTKDQKAGMETHLVIVGAKIRKCSI